MPLPTIDPPLLNSANPWCSTREDLEALYACPHTGAVTTRTGLLLGFSHDPSIHQHAFFSTQSQTTTTAPDYTISGEEYPASLNTLGYSPTPIDTYLDWIENIVNASPNKRPKPFIVSVTGSPKEVAECYSRVAALAARIPTPLAVEVNLSCPNIANKPPPAYSGSALKEYLDELRHIPRTVSLGLKTPPYTYAGQFKTLIDTLRENGTSPIDFITSTNTLGSCLILSQQGRPLLPSAVGTGIGGLAGEPLHPLALGNVATLRRLLDEHAELCDIDIIGVGGVSDAAGLSRMQAVGAKVVAIGTALGREGIPVFAKILHGTKNSKL
ncbi:FMN-linked oxidoreductase [Aureobasidium sp. EXF-12298]|nr:FMN-linked oxidoreductase [Aureobasidium sp. EXF-12298]KAI4750355.1 FMN-linked oxidoreductase [Aureobasidium sp. EXF-12344]KAI4767903.1 FMN-linked oxidoreductase [Aureobasidium sp. EXF-3400]